LKVEPSLTSIALSRRTKACLDQALDHASRHSKHSLNIAQAIAIALAHRHFFVAVRRAGADVATSEADAGTAFRTPLRAFGAAVIASSFVFVAEARAGLSFTAANGRL
jgi:hypothetical protein